MIAQSSQNIGRLKSNHGFNNGKGMFKGSSNGMKNKGDLVGPPTTLNKT